MELLEQLQEGMIIFVRALIKALTGFIIIPLGILVNNIKPEWEESPKTVKYITGIILIPLTGFLLIAAPWWDDFEIVD